MTPASAGALWVPAFFTSAGAIAIGEIGDKTQLLALLLASRVRQPLAIIAGIMLAVLLSSLLAAFVGQWAHALLTATTLRWLLGLSFLAIAVWTLIPERQPQRPEARGATGAFVVALISFFLAELGDRTQILTAALAARYGSLLSVTAGASVGMMLINIPTVLLAGRLLRRVPLNLIRWIAAAAYALLGLATLLGYWNAALPAGGFAIAG